MQKNYIMNLQYVVNNIGERVSAIVPVSELETLLKKCRKLEAKVDVLIGIQNGFKELKTVKQNGSELQTLEDFLNENRH